MGKEFYATSSTTYDIYFYYEKVQKLGKHVFVARANRDTLKEGREEQSASNRSSK